MSDVNLRAIPVFMASDEKYAGYMAVTMASILDNSVHKIDFFILDGGIYKDTKRKLKELERRFSNCNIEFIKIDVDQFKDFPNLKHFSLNTYSRYLIPNFKPEFDKVLYVDGDMVFNGDVAEIYNVEMGDAPIAVVPYIDECDERIKNPELKKHKKRLGIPEEVLYFNSGLTLINCKYWREHNILELLLDKTTQMKSLLKMPDQDVMNILFGKTYVRLPNHNNVVVDVSCNLSDFREYIDHISGCLVLHYTGGQGLRPWMRKNVPYEELFWRNAKLTEFYQDLEFELLHNVIKQIGKIDKQKIKIKLFGFIPFFSIKKRGNVSSVLLFGIIPLLKIKVE